MKFDSTIARKYYDSTKYNYVTDKKYDLSEISFLSDTLSKEVYQRIQNGESFDELASIYTQRAGARAKKGHIGEFSAVKNKYSSLLRGEPIKTGLVIKPKKFQTGYSILRVNKIIDSRKTTSSFLVFNFAITFFMKPWSHAVREDL